MTYKVILLLLLCMIFCHIVDDYYLQGWLASAKQRDWWKKNSPDSKYKYDYIMALFMHSFSWTFSVMLVPTIYSKRYELAIVLFLINLIVHGITDNAKANLKKINLIQDQLVHLIQIIITWACLLVFE